MFPMTYAFSKCRFMISPTSVVVVVFPLVPVMAITLPFSHWYASSISPQIGIPFSRNCSTKGVSTGTPGLTTSNCVFSFISSVNSLKQISASKSAGSFSLISSSFMVSPASNRMGFAPCFFRKTAAPIPLFPHPIMSTFFPAKFMFYAFPCSVSAGHFRFCIFPEYPCNDIHFHIKILMISYLKSPYMQRGSRWL